jgi:hypothetical protein
MNGFFDPFVGGSGGGGSGTGPRGPKGDKGDPGNGIASIVFKSSTGGSTPGIPGATDTYQINYTKSTPSTFIVKNGN